MSYFWFVLCCTLQVSDARLLYTIYTNFVMILVHTYEIKLSFKAHFNRTLFKAKIMIFRYTLKSIQLQKNFTSLKWYCILVMCDISILYRYRGIFALTVSYRNQYCICLCYINIKLQNFPIIYWIIRLDINLSKGIRIYLIDIVFLRNLIISQIVSAASSTKLSIQW